MSKQEEFINAVAPIVVPVVVEYGLPPSLCLAQLSLESGFGSSAMAQKGNNYLGRKWRKGDKDAFDFYWSKEEIPDFDPADVEFPEDYEPIPDMPGWYNKRSRFKHYPSIVDCVRDWCKRLTTYGPYVEAIERAESLEECIEGVARVYATDSRYSLKIFSLIDEYDLRRFDNTPEEE